MKKAEAAAFYHEVREAFGQSGCPFCRLLNKSADRYLDAILWEMVNDVETRAELNRARGYCQRHGWMLVRAGAGLGIAILTRDVVKTLLAAMDAHPLETGSESGLRGLMHRLDPNHTPEATARLLDALVPQAPCPVCVHLESLERDYADTLLVHLDAAGQLAEAYRGSDGLCQAHFCQTLARAQSVQKAKILVILQREVWQRLHAELGEFIRKQDYRFKDEPYGAEKDSWRRALEAVSGAPPPSESERRGLTG